jgi:hypothetical protein
MEERLACFTTLVLSPDPQPLGLIPGGAKLESTAILGTIVLLTTHIRAYIASFELLK